MATPRQIGIVGCGIAGTAVALMLARAGHRVTLFEQTEHIGPIGAGVLLQPSGQRVLANLGLMDRLWPTVEPIEEVHAVTERGKDLVRLRYGDYQPGLKGVGLHRGDLFSLLHGQLEAAGVRLLLGTPIERVELIIGTPVVYDAGGAYHGPFDLLIAADGSRSRLREACGLHTCVTEYDYGAIWAVGDVAPIRGKLFQAAHGTTQLGGILPIGGGRCSLFWGMHRKRIAEVMRRGFGPWRDDVLKLMPDAEPLVDRVGSLEATRFVTYRHIGVRKIARGRVVFIGDAAHAMSPHLGQGVNLALQDAETLASAVAESDSMSAAIKLYVARRRATVRQYAAVTAFLSPFFQSDWGVLGMGRNLALPLLSNFPPTRRAMLKMLCGVG